VTRRWISWRAYCNAHCFQSNPEREKGAGDRCLKEAETKPESIADKVFHKALFGTHLMRCRFPARLPASKNYYQDLRDFYAARYRAGSAVVAIMGDVTRLKQRPLRSSLPKNCRHRLCPPHCPRWR